MMTRYMLRLAIGLVLLVAGYFWLGSPEKSLPGSDREPSERVEVTPSDAKSSTPNSVETKVNERGETVLISTDKPEAAKRKLSQRQVWSSTGSMSAEQNARSHWAKHGSEFPEYKTAEEYIAGAQAFVSQPPAGTQTKNRPNGDRLFYNPRDGTFAVCNREGAPRTMFRPNNGRDYWSRQ